MKWIAAGMRRWRDECPWNPLFFAEGRPDQKALDAGEVLKRLYNVNDILVPTVKFFHPLLGSFKSQGATLTPFFCISILPLDDKHFLIHI
jgi:hypothetical protein